MRARARNGLRRLAAGLVVLSILVLSVAQTVALSVRGSTSFNGTSHGIHHPLMTPPDDVHDHSVLPGKHDGCPEGSAGCIACGCSMPFIWLPAAAPALLAIAPRALAWPDGTEMAPDGAAAAPAVPPPRHMVSFGLQIDGCFLA